MSHLGVGAIGLLMLGLVALVAACQSAPNPGGPAGPRGAPSAEGEPRSVDIGGMKVPEPGTGGGAPEEPPPHLVVLPSYPGAPAYVLAASVRSPSTTRSLIT